MKRVAFAFFALLLVVAFAGTLLFLWRKSHAPPTTFETATLRTATIVKKTVATGSVVPRKEVEVKPQVSGIVEELFVEPGVAVNAGDPVARIRIVPDMVSLANAESRVNRSRIDLADRKREGERSRRLHAEGTVSDSALQQAEVALARAQEESAAAADNLELIRKGSTSRTGSATNTLVRSTLSGTVLEVPVEEGASVIEANTFNAGTTIATVADMSELIFKGKVDESEVGKLKPGMELLLTIGAIEGRSFKAALEHVAPKGVEENGAVQFEIRAALEHQDDVLVRANYSATADIVLDRRDEVLALDEGLVQFEGDKPFVEVESAPQRFEKRPVQLGLSDGITVEVLSGLGPKDRVKKPAPLVAR